MPSETRNSSQSFRMIAKTLYGLETFLARELIDLGARNVKCLNRSVEFFGDKRTLYEANLWCRTATRILKPIATFRVTDEKSLYNQAMKIDWEKYLGLKQTFAMDAVITNSSFGNSLYVAQRTKDAVADYFRERTGQRPSVDLKKPDIRINVYINKQDCTLAIDSSGEPLFRRGYRRIGGKAPLNEVLAAGIVLHSEWDKKSSFVDAMCGSGTIVIEAAMIARNVAPGLTRKTFGFMNWPDYENELFDSVCNKARQAIISKPNCSIMGSDLNRVLVQDAIENAHRALIGGDVSFRQTAIKDLIPPSPPGVLIINPPYGERLSVDDIGNLYSSIGDSLKNNFTGYDAFIFTGNPEAAKNIGLRTSRRIRMYNGSIECRLLKFEMYSGSRKKS